MPKKIQTSPAIPPETDAQAIMGRMVAILEQAKSNVARSINSNMVIAHWLIGRELVSLQDGKSRADYGKMMLEAISNGLVEKYGRGYSVTNLRYFRQFYTVYADRLPEIHHFGGDDLAALPSGSDGQIHHLASDESGAGADGLPLSPQPRGFSPTLSWTHYRSLARVKDPAERLFYEVEAAKSSWSIKELERNIDTRLFLRLLKSSDKEGLLSLSRNGITIEKPIDIMKNPYVLDFVELPEMAQLRESDLEGAIIDQLQQFLLELGKGFAFVARQYRVTTEFHQYWVDLVFYNFLLKCFCLVDIKMGKLTHADVGQMDGYLRLFDDTQKGPGDNPTVGLILCAERDEVVARYSVLNGNEQMFASKYMLYLPSEEELRNEITKDLLGDATSSG
jgi:Uncharacterized conserved protein